MRDPNRIDDFCAKLAEYWHQVPDWRFGQLMLNLMGEIWNNHGDMFFIEDDKVIEYIGEVFDKWNGEES